MAGPNTLQQHGNNVDYPTWGFGRTTKLAVQSLDPNHYATVTVHAGPLQTSSEDVGTTGGGTTVIERSWGGFPINVANSRNDRNVPVRVWTE